MVYTIVGLQYKLPTLLHVCLLNMIINLKVYMHIKYMETK